MFEFWTSILLRLFVIGLLVFANAFFVVSEFALVSVRKTRIQQLSKEGNETAQLVSTELTNIPKFIAAVQLGVTISSLGLGWVGESTLASLFYPLFKFLPETGQLITTHTIAAGIAFILITILHVEFGELVPKSIALQYPENSSLIVAKPMKFILKIFSPFIIFLNGLGTVILGLLKIQPAKGIHLVHSIEELDMLVSASYQEGILNETEREMLHNVFKFSDLITRQIMIPRPDMLCIPVDISLEDLIAFVQEHQFTRYPVFENDQDHIIGIVHIKDVIPFIETKDAFILADIIRKVMIVPETLTIDKLLIEFKRYRNQMAIVIDEFGGTSGLVTLEDVLEEIFGDVQDEFDVEEADVKVISDNEFLINAMLRIDEVNELFNLDVKEEEIETIGGLVLKELGRIAQINDSIDIDKYNFTVDSVEGLRITKLRVIKKP
ncbi:MAG: hemolysin family protein [Candidatus Gastranaerophilales bacterium]|nr:hemolysin family protein [Candidatus Gastranaerophilales bacterium]